MNLFGIPDAPALLTAVVGRELPEDVARLAFARAAWSGVVEPGDRLANVTIDALGADVALDALLEKWDAERLSEALGAEATNEEVSQALARWLPRVDTAVFVRALTQAARVAARLLVPGDPLWPSGLDDLDEHAPIALWVRGTDAALEGIATSIALVGARAATGYGEHVTMEASAGLVDRGYTIVSGAAYGIDGMAHRAVSRATASPWPFSPGELTASTRAGTTRSSRASPRRARSSPSCRAGRRPQNGDSCTESAECSSMRI
jgi:DNA processing protein